jgi:hypothetical protein
VSAATRARRARAPPFRDPSGYARHRPEATLLYQLVERHCPAFRELRSEAGRPLPDYLEKEFDAYLKCGRLEEGFLRVRCEDCHAEKLVAFSCKTRFHGVFAPHSRLRATVTPAHRGIGAPQPRSAADAAKPPTPRHVAMSWARGLKRVFGIEIEGCARCGGKLKILASIEEPEVIAKILAHLEKTAPDQYQAEMPLGARAPLSQARLL